MRSLIYTIMGFPIGKLKKPWGMTVVGKGRRWLCFRWVKGYNDKWGSCEYRVDDDDWDES